MSHSTHEEAEELTRQEAAERLTDMAYALTAGRPLQLGGNQEVPVADRLVLKRACKSNGDRVELELELTWSTASATSPAPPEGGPGE